MRNVLLVTVAIVVAGLLIIQLVPYGRDHVNPPVIAEPAWDSATTRELAKVACFDCHSNETQWPGYASIAPFSWLMQRHVDEGRMALNFSEWGRGEQETGEVAESMRDGRMPPGDYLVLHREARLTDAETKALIDGLTRTVGGGESREPGGGESHEGEGEE